MLCEAGTGGVPRGALTPQALEQNVHYPVPVWRGALTTEARTERCLCFVIGAYLCIQTQRLFFASVQVVQCSSCVRKAKSGRKTRCGGSVVCTRTLLRCFIRGAPSDLTALYSMLVVEPAVSCARSPKCYQNARCLDWTPIKRPARSRTRRASQFVCLGTADPLNLHLSPRSLALMSSVMAASTRNKHCKIFIAVFNLKAYSY